MTHEAELITRAKAGDRRAFDDVVAPHVGMLHSYLLRLLANPEDAADIAQDATLRAFQKLSTFRGDSSFRTWLFSIASNLAIDHLRRGKRWPTTAQLQMHDIAATDESFGADMGATMTAPDFAYEVGEHVAYCFACVGRALEPHVSAALLLREVFDFKNREAATVLGLSESVFRHTVADARRTMNEAFEGMCALINKRGACHQCSTLRGLCPPGRQGPEVEPLGNIDAPDVDLDALLDRRIATVRAAESVGGTTLRMHAVMLRFVAQHLG